MSDEVELPSTKGLGRQAARGAAFTLAGQISRIALQLASVIVLARLLSPRDYGLVAMVTAFAGIAEIFRDFGLSAAAVQALRLSTRQRDNLFWINSAIGLALAMILAACAPLIAHLYGNPELVPLTRAIAVVFLLNGMSTQFRASLNRSLRFKQLAGVDVASPAVALAVAVGFAATGFGYWALAFQQISQALTNLVLLVLVSRWIPGLPHRRESMGGLLRFGWNIVATQLVNYVGQNIDSFTIGIRFGAQPLGIYSRGFQLVYNPVNQLRSPAGSVAIPVLSRLQNEPVRYYDFVLRGQVVLGYTLVAGLGVLISGSVPITAIVLGPRWAEVAPIISLLSVAAIFQTLALVAYWVYVSRGLTGSLFRYTWISVGLKILCITIGASWGIVGVAAGYALATTLSWPISLWWLSRTTPVPVRRLVQGVLRMSGLAGVGIVAGWTTVMALSSQGHVVQVLADIVVTAGVYALGALLFASVRRDMHEVAEVAGMMLRRARPHHAV